MTKVTWGRFNSDCYLLPTIHYSINGWFVSRWRFAFLWFYLDVDKF